MIDKKLLSILVCPVSKAPLEYDQEKWNSGFFQDVNSRNLDRKHLWIESHNSDVKHQSGNDSDGTAQDAGDDGFLSCLDVFQTE